MPVTGAAMPVAGLPWNPSLQCAPQSIVAMRLSVALAILNVKAKTVIRVENNSAPIRGQSGREIHDSSANRVFGLAPQ